MPVTVPVLQPRLDSAANICLYTTQKDSLRRRGTTL